MRTLLLMFAVGCAESEEAGADSPLAPCHVSGLDAESLCGTVTVFEDRAAGSGREIALRVLVVPAISPYPRPDPLFFLAGGPGQAASEVAGAILPALSQIQRHRDLVFVDQRGTGASNGLRCEADEGMSLRERLELEGLDEAQACHPILSEQADLTLYTTDLAVDDLDDVRQALGYETINLYGVSYGTRVAIEYVRRHADSARAVILDGVVPPQMPAGLHFATDGQAALDALLDDCAASSDCAAAFPELRGALAETLARLDVPEPVEVTIAHPRTGVTETIPMAYETFAGGLQGMLYSPAIASLAPLSILAAQRGEYDAFVAQTLGMSEGVGGSMYDGMQLSVMCAEDLSRYPTDRATLSEGTMLRDVTAAEMSKVCGVWPQATMPAGLDEPLVSDVPVLLLSGALDPVTPPRWGALAAETLSSSLHLVAPGAGHNVGPSGCVPRLMAEFVDAGFVEELDGSCIDQIQRPPFFIDFAGPAQ
ncbi:MAG: pimeloyl-ACP methyl ester carboxylesterase [Myxococcota bacterium]|jgi:pimeloyl-ACP methyl ester carboxylesterase